MKALSNLKRFVDYLENETHVYSYWVIGCLGLFMAIGTLPTLNRIYQEYTTLQEMRALEQVLTKKVADLKNAASVMRELNPYLPYLDMYVPENFVEADYMLEISVAGSKNNFALKTFSPSTKQATKREFVLKFVGSGDIHGLVEDLEKLKRVTKVISVDQNFDKKTTESNITVLTYSLTQ